MIAIKGTPSSTPLHHSPRTHPHLSSLGFFHRRLLPAGVKWHQPHWSSLNQCWESQISSSPSIPAFVFDFLFFFQRAAPFHLKADLSNSLKNWKSNAHLTRFHKEHCQWHVVMGSFYGFCSDLPDCTPPACIICDFIVNSCEAALLTSEIKAAVTWEKKKSHCSTRWWESALPV